MENMGIRNTLAYLAAFSAMATVDYVDRIDKPTRFNPNDIEPKTPPKPKNHKIFVIDGMEIWALNRKNAIKKFNKLYAHSSILN